MSSDATLFGQRAETEACSWLQSNGFRILDRNWRRPWGELDIVAEKHSVLRFIEVKASNRSHVGFEPFMRADFRKMQKVRRTARTWMAVHGVKPDSEWQLDVLSVIMDADNPVFEHFENI